MKYQYYVVRNNTKEKYLVEMRKATVDDFKKTKSEGWETDWNSDYIQNDEFMKYALYVKGTNELIGMGAYRNIENEITVFIEFIESSRENNPRIVDTKKYDGIGSVLLAFGIQLSLEFGYNGDIFLLAKNDYLRDYYIQKFGAIHLPMRNRILLIITGEASNSLICQYRKEEPLC